MEVEECIIPKIYFKNKDFILKINMDKKSPNISWSSEYLKSHDFYEIIKNTDNKNLVDYLIENINNTNIKEVINLFKYSLCNVYFLDYEKENKYFKDLIELANKLNKSKEIGINFYNPPLLYRLSYFNFNKREIMIEYNKLIKKSLPTTNFSINFKKKKRQKIKIGFFCSYMMSQGICSVFRDRSEIFKRLNPNIFDKYLIYCDMTDELNSKEKSGNSQYLKKFVNSMHYHIKIDFNLNKLDYTLKQLYDLELDVIVYASIGMDPRSVIFSNYRLAPVQINTWGHSITSGSSEIDYFFSSKYYELEDLNKAQEFYSEKLVALDSLCTYYLNFNIEKYSQKEELKLPLNKNILFCLQYYKKINLEFLDILSKILSKLDNTIVIMLNDSIITEKQEFIKNKLNGKILFIDKCDYPSFNSYIYYSTLILDTYPFGGCNTSMDSFSRGRMVITRPSDYLPGRFTYGFYKKMDIMEPVCSTYEEYIEKVVFYVNNKVEREKIEQKIISRRYLIFEEEDSVKEWESKIIELVEPFTEITQLNITFNYEIATPLCLLMSKYKCYKGGKNILESWHNYSTLYYELFKDIKNNELRIFEMGIGTKNLNIPFNSGSLYNIGASLLVWQEFFPNSKIFGADIDGDSLFHTERIKTYYCDQKNPFVIDYMWKEKELLEDFDIIIDDGYKDIKYNYLFFEKSIEKLKEEGYYFIEGIPNHQISLWKDKIQQIKLKYNNLLLYLIQIASRVNSYDNNILLIKKIKE